MTDPAPAQPKPRLLVLAADSQEVVGREEADPLWRSLSDRFELIREPSIYATLQRLGEGRLSGIWVETTESSQEDWTHLALPTDQILAIITDGVAVLNWEGRILWCNPAFASDCPDTEDPRDQSFYEALGDPERLGSDPLDAVRHSATRQCFEAKLRLKPDGFLRLRVSPVLRAGSGESQMIAITRDLTQEMLQTQKIEAIHRAGEELAALTPEDLADLSPEDRIEVLKYKIVEHVRELLGFDFVEIRLLRPESGLLVPLLSEGMTDWARKRAIYAGEQGHGVTGLVAATRQSYLCHDVQNDPHYLEGAENAGSSLTVPLMATGQLIGTFNVESLARAAFTEQDQQFLEIYAGSVAMAIKTLQLLQVERRRAASASIGAVRDHVALPLDEILNDATIVLDRYAGHDEDIVHRLRDLIHHAREIRSLIAQVGSKIEGESAETSPTAVTPSIAQTTVDPGRLQGYRILVVDAEESVRSSAHSLLEKQGAIVETARTANEAYAQVRQTRYDVALVDIRLPDFNGYETFTRLRALRPTLAVVLMTGFGYDPTHSIVKARREGLDGTLYTPFKAEQLSETVEHAQASSQRRMQDKLSAPEEPQNGRHGSPNGSENLG